MPDLKHDATAFFKLSEGDGRGRYEKLRLMLGEVDGVSDVKVDSILDTLSVKHDSEKVTLNQLKKKVDLSDKTSG